MLRLRLILWYSLLVIMTIIAVGLIQSFIIRRSLLDSLDNSLIEDAQITLKLISSLPSSTDLSVLLKQGQMHSNGTLRDLVDHVLGETPDTIKGENLTDRVVSRLVDDVLMELSYQDSSGTSVDPLDVIVDRTVSGRRNNLVEIYVRPSLSAGFKEQSVFRTPNLKSDTMVSAIRAHLARGDTIAALGNVALHGERIRVARAKNERFDVYVGYPTTDIEENLGNLRSSFFFIIPFSLLISTLGGLWLARKALRPIEQIADSAKEIGAKNLSQRIQIPGKTDHELVTLTETLNLMFERLESSFQQIAQFTSDASHELRTPLAIMKGEIEQAQRQLESTRSVSVEAANEMLGSLMEEVDRMQRIVEGLLMLSRADDHKLPLEIEAVPIAEFLGTLAEDAAILAEDRGLTFMLEISHDAVEIFLPIDRTRMYQVVMNLLGNGLKYTPPGGRVTLFLKTDTESVFFGVRDTGIGISAEDQQKVFRRFFRSDEARTGIDSESTRSLGLGLAIVKSIVEAHGATIQVESLLGTGSTFTVRFPRSMASNAH